MRVPSDNDVPRPLRCNVVFLLILSFPVEVPIPITFVQLTPRWSPFAMRRSPHQLISGRGKPPVPRSLVQRCEGTGAPREDGTHLLDGVFQPNLSTVTHPTLESVMFRSSPPFGDPQFIFRLAPSGTRPVSR